MKVLTHEGIVVTLPFTLNDIPASDFELLNGKGSAAVCIVAEMEEATVRRQIRQASQLERAFASARQITSDIRFIAKSLIDVADGAEIRLETKGSRIKLVIPESARPQREPISAGDRVAVNASVSPKTLMNAHGTVESIQGKKATIKVDEGDRQRVIRATGKDVTPAIQVPLGILDKLHDSK